VSYPIGEVDFSGENRQEEEEKKYGSEESVKEERTKVPSKLSFRTQTDGDQGGCTMPFSFSTTHRRSLFFQYFTL
jgi:hypothetical protein